MLGMENVICSPVSGPSVICCTSVAGRVRPKMQTYQFFELFMRQAAPIDSCTLILLLQGYESKGRHRRCIF